MQSRKWSVKYTGTYTFKSTTPFRDVLYNKCNFSQTHTPGYTCKISIFHCMK